MSLFFIFVIIVITMFLLIFTAVKLVCGWRPARTPNLRYPTSFSASLQLYSVYLPIIIVVFIIIIVTIVIIDSAHSMMMLLAGLSLLRSRVRETNQGDPELFLIFSPIPKMQQIALLESYLFLVYV